MWDTLYFWQNKWFATHANAVRSMVSHAKITFLIYIAFLILQTYTVGNIVTISVLLLIWQRNSGFELLWDTLYFWQNKYVCDSGFIYKNYLSWLLRYRLSRFVNLVYKHSVIMLFCPRTSFAIYIDNLFILAYGIQCNKSLNASVSSALTKHFWLSCVLFIIPPPPRPESSANQI